MQLGMGWKVNSEKRFKGWEAHHREAQVSMAMGARFLILQT